MISKSMPIPLLIIGVAFFCASPTVQFSNIDNKSHLVKITTTIMIENDGNTPITQHLIDCDERNGHSRLSHIVAKLSNDPMPVSKTEDGKWWRIDLSSKPVEPGVTTPLMVTKVYTHLELVPSHDVYLIPYSQLQYQVRIIKQGRPQKVKVPSDQYYLVVDNKDLVDLDESTSTVQALEIEGTTRLRFIDKSVIQDEDFIQPESTIHIVNPAYLTMHVTPGDSWALQKFYDYTLEIRVHDANHNQIFPSSNLDIQLSYGSEIVLTNSTNNGTYHTFHTISSGSSKLTAKLIGTSPTMYAYDKSYPDIEHEQELYIYDPLTVKPGAIILPWLPGSKPSYKVQFSAEGGTGSFVWSTNDTTLADIKYSDEDSSSTKVATRGYGSATIECSDIKSPVFSKKAMLVVSDIVELDILPSITETELGGDLLIPVAVYANRSALNGLPDSDEIETKSNLVLFHDCSAIGFDVDIVEKSRFSHEPNDVHPKTRPGACASIRLTCNQAGSSRIWISYTDPTSPLSKPIKTTTVIACFKPLKTVYPVETGVLALDTSIDLAFEGGPRPFGSKLDDHYAYLEPNDSSIIKFEPIIDRYRLNKDLHVFRAHCKGYGDVGVTLNVGNKPSISLPNPAYSKAVVRIICGEPNSIELVPKVRESCPLNNMASLSDVIVPVSSKQPTEFDILLLDDHRRPFLNASLSKIDVAFVGDSKFDLKPREEINGVAGFRKLVRSFITITPKGKPGKGKLSVSTRAIHHNLHIEFVDDAVTTSNKSIIYNHQRNVVVLGIENGSGFFSVETLHGGKHANLSYINALGQHLVAITPISLGKFTLRVQDECIDAPADSDVIIVDKDEFAKQARMSDRSLTLCDKIDKSMFCVYLSVDTTSQQSTSFTTQNTQQIPTTSQPQHVTTRAPVQHQTTPMPVQVPSTTPRPIQFQTTAAPVTQSPFIVPSPQISFESMSSSKNSNNNNQGLQDESSLFKRVLGYLLTFVITASSIILAFKWWQEKTKSSRNNSSQFAPESSFLQQSPGSRNVRFSPSQSQTSSGPTSSTPRSRPLYSERYSTTLFSD